MTKQPPRVIPATVTYTVEGVPPLVLDRRWWADQGAAVTEAVNRAIGAQQTEAAADRAARLARQEERETQRQAWIRHEQAKASAHRNRVLAATGDPLALAVLMLHSPDTEYGAPKCRGCETSGMEAEAIDWPCDTWRLVEGMIDR